MSKECLRCEQEAYPDSEYCSKRCEILSNTDDGEEAFVRCEVCRRTDYCVVVGGEPLCSHCIHAQ